MSGWQLLLFIAALAVFTTAGFVLFGYVPTLFQ